MKIQTNKTALQYFVVIAIQFFLSLWLLKGAVSFGFHPTIGKVLAAAGLKFPWQPVISIIETVGAILFSFRKTMVFGASLLMTSFVMAIYLHIVLNERPINILLYSVAVVLLLIFRRRQTGSLNLQFEVNK